MEQLAGFANRLMNAAYEEAERLTELAPVDALRSGADAVCERQFSQASDAESARWFDDLITAPTMSWRGVQTKITVAGMFATFSPGGWLVFRQLGRLLNAMCGPLPQESSEAGIRSQFPALSAWIADASPPAFEACAREMLDLEGLRSKVKPDLQIPAAA